MIPEEVQLRHVYVLEAVATLAATATVARTVVLLTAPQRLSRRLRRTRVAGALADAPSTAVRTYLAEALELGLLERRAAAKSTMLGLGLTDAGLLVLQNQLRLVNRWRRWWQREQRPLDPDVLSALRAWRDETARERETQPRRIMTERTLARVAALQPYLWSELLQVPALRRCPDKLADWGESLLDCVFAAVPAADELLVPESGEGKAYELDDCVCVVLDDYSQLAAGMREKTRVGDALRLLRSGRHPWMAQVLARKLIEMAVQRQVTDVCAVSSVPRLAGRNGSQSAGLLAHAVARRWNCPGMPPQGEQDRVWVLVDTVIRSGTTLRSALQTCRQQHTGAVFVLAVASVEVPCVKPVDDVQAFG